MHIFILIICLLLILIGLLGCILPALPGVPLVFTGIYIYAWATGFTVISRKLIIVFLALTVFSVFIEYILTSIGLKKFGASKFGFLGAFLGAFAGIFFSPWGLIIGPLCGAFLGEVIGGKSLKESLKSGSVAFLGFLGGSFLKIVISFSMISLFSFKVLKHLI